TDGVDSLQLHRLNDSGTQQSIPIGHGGVFLAAATQNVTFVQVSLGQCRRRFRRNVQLYCLRIRRGTHPAAYSALLALSALQSPTYVIQRLFHHYLDIRRSTKATRIWGITTSGGTPRMSVIMPAPRIVLS